VLILLLLAACAIVCVPVGGSVVGYGICLSGCAGLATTFLGNDTIGKIFQCGKMGRKYKERNEEALETCLKEAKCE